MRNPKKKSEYDPVVDPRFADACAIAFITIVIMALVLVLAAPKPIHTYSIVGGVVFGLCVGSFLYGCARLAISDSKREHK